MRRLAVSTALAAVLFSLAPEALAQTADWRRLGRDGPFEVAVDIASFDGPRTARTVRSVLVPLDEEASAYHHMILDVRIDCEARTISAGDTQVLDASGAVLAEGTMPPDTTPVSETDGTARLARAVCDGAGLDNRRFESAKVFAAWAVAQPIE